MSEQVTIDDFPLFEWEERIQLSRLSGIAVDLQAARFNQERRELFEEADVYLDGLNLFRQTIGSVAVEMEKASL